MNKDKILGALYGFAIGDAMGATTEFMSKEKIESKYGRVRNILGGGVLNWDKGEVTDDTQMMMCVIDAIMSFDFDALDEIDNEEDFIEVEKRFQNDVVENFVKWYLSRPKDIGCQTSFAIRERLQGIQDLCPIAENESALGNGGLMRALPLAIVGEHSLNVSQCFTTHNNATQRASVLEYSALIRRLVCGGDVTYSVPAHNEPRGEVRMTLNNAKYWGALHVNVAIVGAVNDGGDADTIAALAGSIAGARDGANEINEKWLQDVDQGVLRKLENFAEFACKFS